MLQEKIFKNENTIDIRTPGIEVTEGEKKTLILSFFKIDRIREIQQN